MSVSCDLNPMRSATVVGMDFEVMYRAMDSRDRRFDGRFFTAVKSTGIYCRPICPAPTPKRKNTVFYRYAAVAEHAGFRPCRRCRPEVSPDTAEWDTRADLVGRGLRLIAEGAADAGSVASMAHQLGVSERHLQRLFKAEIGATPGVIARSRRARLARQLLTETSMPVTDVAFAAGFSSVRTFNDTVSKIYKVTPTELRRGTNSDLGALQVILNFRPPLVVEPLLRSLRARAVPGVEEVDDTSYRRVIRVGDNAAVIELRPSTDAVILTIHYDRTTRLAPIVQRARQLFDLDADPEAISEHLEQSDLLRTLVIATPGLRLAGSYNWFQTGVQVILEQRSTPTKAAARAGRLAQMFGTPLDRPEGSLTHSFPSPNHLVSVDLTGAGVPDRQAATVAAFSQAVCDGAITLDGSIDPDTACTQLLAVPGMGSRTISALAFRILRDPDAFPLNDDELQLLLPGAIEGDPQRLSDEWRPWRGYAATHLLNFEHHSRSKQENPPTRPFPAPQGQPR